MQPSGSYKRQQRTMEWISWIILGLIALVFIYPFLFMVLKSFDETANFGLKFPPTLLPVRTGLRNYISSLQMLEIGRFYFNTIYVSVWACILHLGLGGMAGYALSKGIFRNKHFWLLFILSTMMIPNEAIVLTRFLIFKDFGLVNTYLGLILPSLAYPFGIFLCKQYFDGIPGFLREAAKIDGANEFEIFYKIYLPLAGPIMATLTILTVMSQWNSLMWPLLMLTKPDMYTISLGIAVYAENEMKQAVIGNSLAISTMAVLPVVIIYLFLQKYIIQSIASSGAKG
ncbi:carbohydrate ABC transporter permease [Paenibacillus cremeus]|nr:carbohydrate ABC transporter permease [Paenibacillus cremeus]